MEELGIRLCDYGLTVCILEKGLDEDISRRQCDVVTEEPWIIIPFPGVFTVY